MPIGELRSVQVSRVQINTSTSGASTLVAAITGKKIRVVSLVIMANAAVNVTFQSHTTTTTALGPFYFAANGGLVLPEANIGWLGTVAGEALDINLSGAVLVGGALHYIQVT